MLPRRDCVHKTRRRGYMHGWFCGYYIWVPAPFLGAGRLCGEPLRAQTHTHTGNWQKAMALWRDSRYEWEEVFMCFGQERCGWCIHVCVHANVFMDGMHKCSIGIANLAPAQQNIYICIYYLSLYRAIEMPKSFGCWCVRVCAVACPAAR